MRATLHQDASNTYYGQWNARFCRQTPRIDRSIAHNDVAREHEIGAVDVRGAFLLQIAGSAAE